MATVKKQWVKPQLIVLARGTPEESVLAACKNIGIAGGPELAVQDACANLLQQCAACQSRGGS